MISKQVFLHTAVQAMAWIATAAACAQQPYSITGQLGKDLRGMAQVTQYTRDGRGVQDSALIKNGLFMIKGNVTHPGKAQLILHFDEQGAASMDAYKIPGEQPFYLEGAAYTVKIDPGAGATVITGGSAQTEYTILAALHQSIDEQLKGFNETVRKYKTSGNDSGMQHLNELLAPLFQKSNAIDSTFIQEHPDSYVAFDLWRRSIRMKPIVPSVVEPVFLHFSERIRRSEEATKLATDIANAKKLDIGQPVDGITLKDTLGQTLSLSSLKGKYVLIWFWQKNVMDAKSQATSMARVNKLFKDKGLYVLTVSADNNPDYAAMPPCLLVGPDGKILVPRLALNNELPRTIGMYIAPAAPTGEADVYVGGDMMQYPQVEWIKGPPVTTFEKDRIYIVELWATWCVPCVAAMPHLNELSKKFAGKITIIGQDVFEEDKGKVEKFVEKKGDGLTYRIAFAGGGSSDFNKKWIEPAGVMNIPQTFIIQNNKLVWQTHPNFLNEAVLQLLVDKKFTLAAAEALAEKH
jgi:thiol-disulfide isomerase/thioredoxin